MNEPSPALHPDRERKAGTQSDPAPADSGSTGSTPPDWSNVPFPVGCARCGHDLHGRSEPVCPACQFAFDWADAVPIERLTCARCGYHLYGLKETRCPECGTEFKWEEALDRYQRSRKPIFEYQWRHRPVRSFFGTWWLALRPWKMWRVIDLHDSPRVPAIFVFGLLVVFVSCCLLAAQLAHLALYFNLRWLSYRSMPPLSWWEFVMETIEDMIWRNRNEFPLEIPFAATFWAFGSFLGILILRQSLHRARIRTPHLVRSIAYATLPVLPFYSAFSALPFVAASLVLLLWRDGTEFRIVFFLESLPTAQIPGAICVTCATISLAIAVRRYLRLPHATGIAVGSMLIGVLGSAVVCMVTMGPDAVGSVLLECARTMGIEL